MLLSFVLLFSAGPNLHRAISTLLAGVPPQNKQWPPPLLFLSVSSFFILTQIHSLHCPPSSRPGAYFQRVSWLVLVQNLFCFIPYLFAFYAEKASTPLSCDFRFILSPVFNNTEALSTNKTGTVLLQLAPAYASCLFVDSILSKQKPILLVHFLPSEF